MRRLVRATGTALADAASPLFAQAQGLDAQGRAAAGCRAAGQASRQPHRAAQPGPIDFQPSLIDKRKHQSRPGRPVRPFETAHLRLFPRPDAAAAARSSRRARPRLALVVTSRCRPHVAAPGPAAFLRSSGLGQRALDRIRWRRRRPADRSQRTHTQPSSLWARQLTGLERGGHRSEWAAQEGQLLQLRSSGR